MHISVQVLATIHCMNKMLFTQQCNIHITMFVHERQHPL